MLKSVEAAGHEELRKIQRVSLLEEPLQNSRSVRSCLNGPWVETNYNPLKDQTDLAEVVYFKSGAPDPHTKGKVWEKSRGTHAQYPHHAVKAAIMTQAVSHTELILQYNIFQVYTGSHPNMRQLQCWVKVATDQPSITKQRERGGMDSWSFHLWKRNNRMLQYAVWPGSWLSH